MKYTSVMVATAVCVAVLVSATAYADVYGYDGNWFYSALPNDLTRQSALFGGYGDQVDIAAGEHGIYGVDNNYIRRWGYDGTYYGVGYQHPGIDRVDVGPDGYVYALIHTTIIRVDPLNLKSLTVLGTAGGIVDFTVGQEALYGVGGGYIFKFDLSDMTILDQSLNHPGLTCVAADGNGYVYAYNGNAIIRVPESNMQAPTVISSGYPGQVDIAADTTGVFMTDGVNIRRWPLDGPAHTTTSPSGTIFTIATYLTCEDTHDMGFGLAADLNEDCYVEWADFGIFASQWQQCSDPDDDTCQRPWMP